MSRSVSQLSNLFSCFTISRSIFRSVHSIPRDFNKVYRGGVKFYVPPPKLGGTEKCPFKNDPNRQTTRDDRKLIHGPQHKLPRDGGRDPETGRKIFATRGGGVDRQMREIMDHRVPEDTEGTLKYRVIQIQECEVRNADLALIAGPSIEYILQPEGLNVGDIVEASKETLGSIGPGCSYPLNLIPIGTQIHAIEAVPGKGALSCKTAGSVSEVIQHTLLRDKTLVKYPSGISQWLDSDCMCTIGKVKLTARAVEPLGSWKVSRAKGRKPRANRQRTQNWRKRKLKHRRDQKWAKRTLRYLDDRIWAGQEGWVPEAYERFRYHYGDRNPQHFIRRLRERDPFVMKNVLTPKFEAREEKPYQCSYETLTEQRTEVFWMRRARWRKWKEIKRLKR